MRHWAPFIAPSHLYTWLWASGLIWFLGSWCHLVTDFKLWNECFTGLGHCLLDMLGSLDRLHIFRREYIWMLGNWFAAPEVIKALQGQYDGTLADVWSCGVLLYVLLFHCYPFERPDDPPGPAAFKLVRCLLNPLLELCPGWRERFCPLFAIHDCVCAMDSSQRDRPFGSEISIQ